ncbi:MAG: tetratricopeptide repeat protein [Sulfuritalea sp.]|nr:tetratricopeptide repeat protein [Sulfuritalea sp.]
MGAANEHPGGSSEPEITALTHDAVEHFRAGRPSEAMATIERGLTLNPDHFGLLNNKGLCAMRLGDSAAAEAAYRRALAIQPNFPEGWNNLGNLLAATQRPGDAEAAYRSAIAIRPDYSNARFNLARVLIFQRRWPESEGILLDLIRHTSSPHGACAALAAARIGQGKYEEAEDACRRALSLHQDNVDALCNLGLAVAKLHRPDEAFAAYAKVLETHPDNPNALLNRANLLLECRRIEEAEADYAHALRVGGDSASLRFGLGNLRWHQARLAEAESHFREAIRLDPGFPMAWNNLGGVLHAMQRHADAEHAFRRELARDGRNRDARWNLALMLLALGRYEEGWQAYEVRLGPGDIAGNSKVFLVETSAISTAHAMPDLWRGDDLGGKRVLAWSEGGFGDEIQFVRYLPLLRSKGVRHLTLACKPETKALFEHQGFADQVICKEDWQSRMADEFDGWCPLMSLPLRFGTRLDSIPASLPYLKANPELVARWKPRLGAPGLRVGLVWGGNPRHENDPARSLPGLATLAPLWSVPDIRFVSLQKGEGENEALDSLPDRPLLHLGTDIADFADTAAIVGQLDLVISVDTSSAHLAAASGTATWVLLPKTGTDWRWLLDREDSPWYPGVARLFRQDSAGDWEGVVSRLVAALQEWRQDRSR